jgi:ubiquinone biosynthesis protein COQ4
VTGYKGDVLGELALLAFIVAQIWHLGGATIVLAGVIKFTLAGRRDAIPFVFNGFRRGRAAAWMSALDWESLLSQPIDQVRAELRLGPPPVYEPVRSAALRAQGLL